MNIILIGIQGSGKSTQGNLLSQKLKLPYLSSGHIFRDMAKEKTRWGRYVKETINAGLLIPDSKVVPIVKEYLSKLQYQKGFILDGFPRTLSQAKAFKNPTHAVIYLEVSDREALWRLAYRNDTVREDETIQAIRKRIELFHTVTKPVLGFYKRRGVLLSINGEQRVQQVHGDMLKALNALVKKPNAKH